MQDILSSIIDTISGYKKFSKTNTTAIVIESGYFLNREIALSLSNIGVEVFKIPLYKNVLDDPSMKNSEEVNPQFIDQLIETIYSNRADFIITINMIGFDKEGNLLSLLEKLKLPIVNYFTDTPFGIIENYERFDSSYLHSFCWEKSYIPQFKRIFNKHNIYYLPYGAMVENSTTFNPKFSSKISFVGNSMFEAVEEWRNKADIPQKVLDQFHEKVYYQDKLSEIPSIAQSFIDDYRIEPYSSSLLYFIGAKIVRERIFSFLDERGVSVDIYGDNYWGEYRFKKHKLRGRINYYKELPQLFRSSEISLNSTSPQMATSLNQRVYDCFVHGGFLLTDYREDLDIIFSNYPFYNTLEQLEKQIDFFISNPKEIDKSKKEIGSIVTKFHNYENRMRYIITTLEKYYR